MKGLRDVRDDDFYDIIHHIFELEYQRPSKKIPLIYCTWFDPTLAQGFSHNIIL